MDHARTQFLVLTPMLLISDPKTGLSDDEDSDLVFDNFTLSAICKSECWTGYTAAHTP